MTVEKIYDHYKIIFNKDPGFDPVALSNLTHHLSANPYGDWVGLCSALYRITQEFPNDNYKILEVGTAHGHFVRTMFNFLEVVKPGKSTAIGMDSKLHGYCPCQIVGDRMSFVDGSSTDTSVTDKLDNDFHFIFIDACHCALHVEKDLKTFSRKIRPGGYVALHDTSPTFQQGTEQPRTPECGDDCRIGVVKGIENFHMENNGFEFILEEYDTNSYWGGVTVYRRA